MRRKTILTENILRIPNRNSSNATRGRRMNAERIEMMSVRTRSGKNEIIQNPQTMIPRRKSTFTIGLLDVAIIKRVCLDDMRFYAVIV
jgi:hypothetical protein